jgi:hypothetical protein
MMIIEIIGGLGNQMFQYAFYYALKKRYDERSTKIYIDRFKTTVDNQGYELQNVFQINNVSDIYCKDVSVLVDNSMSMASRIRRKILGPKETYFLEKKFRYDSKVFELKNNGIIYFRGLWQDETYFKEYRAELLLKFKFPPLTDEININILNIIENCNAVSIHIRRGDYVNNPKYKDILGDVCNYKYYNEAVNLIKSKESLPVFFVFSDDIEWVENNFDFLKESKVYYISNNKGSKSFLDMQLMCNCKHNIIANSTFSWWAAWLNTNDNKIVIGPFHWFKNNKKLQENNIIPDNWVKILN